MICSNCGNEFVGISCPRCGYTNYVPGQYNLEETVSDASPKLINKNKPNIFKRTGNFAKSVVKHAGHGFLKTDDKTKNKRLEICRSCDRYDDKDKSCSECGCFVEIKTAWASEKCPIDKWGQELPKTKGGIILPPPQTGGCGGCGSKKT